MKLVRIQTEEGPVFAAETGDRLVGVVWQEGVPAATDIDAPRGPLLAPIKPSCIIGIGLNYRHHAEETGAKIPEYPVMFFKAPGAACGSGHPIILPKRLRSTQVDFECELAFVISREAKNVLRKNAEDYILGFTAANDVSARDWQKQWGGSQWCRGKSFDTFCPLGPRLVTLDELPNYNNLRLQTRINGQTMQDWRTSDLIFDIPTLIEFLTADTTLPAHTVVLTGTPQGVGMARKPPVWLAARDVVEIEIEGIGVLRNPVAETEA